MVVDPSGQADAQRPAGAEAVAAERFVGFDGWPEEPGVIEVQVADVLYDLHNNANLLTVMHTPAEAALEFRFAYNVDWQQLGGSADQDLRLRFRGVRRLHVAQADDADVRTGHDFEGVTFARDGADAVFEVEAAECRWSFRADQVEFLRG